MVNRLHMPQLKNYVDKQIDLKLNGSLRISGILRGFDPFMNIVVDDTLETQKDGNVKQLGLVVIRGNSIDAMEPRERIAPPRN